MEYNKQFLENKVEFTDDFNKSLWITPDNELISGDYELGKRGTDHRSLLDVYELDREDIESWDRLHEMGYVRVIPETKYALFYKNQPLTDEQKERVEAHNFQLEAYGVVKDEDELEEEKYYDLLEAYAEDHLINSRNDKSKNITVIGVRDSKIVFKSNLQEFEDEFNQQEVDHYLLLHHKNEVYSVKERNQYEMDLKDNPLHKYDALLKQTRVGSLRKYDLEEQAKQKQHTLE